MRCYKLLKSIVDQQLHVNWSILKNLSFDWIHVTYVVYKRTLSCEIFYNWHINVNIKLMNA